MQYVSPPGSRTQVPFPGAGLVTLHTEVMQGLCTCTTYTTYCYTCALHFLHTRPFLAGSRSAQYCTALRNNYLANKLPITQPIYNTFKCQRSARSIWQLLLRKPLKELWPHFLVKVPSIPFYSRRAKPPTPKPVSGQICNPPGTATATIIQRHYIWHSLADRQSGPGPMAI